MSIHVMHNSKYYSNILSIHAIFCSMYYMEIPTNLFEIVVRTDSSIHVAVDTSGFYCIYIYIYIYIINIICIHKLINI